jgi:PAS domain S-box-containing protein
VEDEEDTIDQCSLFLGRYVGSLIIARNGEEGLAAYHHYSPDLILTDIRMPILDGLAMGLEIRKFDRQIPIIVFSAFDRTDYLIKSINIGVDRYVTKPVDINQLLNAMLNCAHRLLIDEQLRKAHVSLNNERQRLETIITGTKAGICQWNVQTGELICNERWAELLGYPLEELTPLRIDTWANLVHPDDLKKSKRLLRKLFLGENENYEHDTRMRHKNQAWIWIEVKAKIHSWTKEGKPLWVFGTCLDLSARKQLEFELLHSETRFRNLFESTLDAILIIDAEHIIDCNPSAVRIFGASSAKTLLGRHPSDLSPAFQQNGEESLTAANMLIEHALNHGEQHFEWLHCRLNNRELFITEVRLAPILVNGQRVISATIRDITERKQVEEELRNSKEQYSLIMQGSKDGIWDWNLLDNCVYYSPAWKEQLGYRDDELENSLATFERLLHPHDKINVMTHIDDYLQGKVQQYDIEFRMQHKNRTWRWIHTRGAAVYNTEGIAMRMVGSHADITETKRQRDELNIIVKRYHLLATHVSDSIWTIGKDTRINHTSPSMENIWGYSQKEAMERTLAEVLAPGSRVLVQEHFQTSEANSNKIHPVKTINGELELRCKDGGSVWVEVTAAALYDETGTLDEILMVTRHLCRHEGGQP